MLDNHYMRIYFVEQEGIFRRTISDFLKDLGHEVVLPPFLEDLPSSLSRDDEAADLLVVSISIADRMALRVLSDVHARYPNMSILVVTDSPEALPADEALICGVYGYLRKPIRLAELELLLIRLSDTKERGNRTPGEEATGHRGSSVKHRTDHNQLFKENAV